MLKLHRIVKACAMIAGASACTVMLACGPQVANGVGEETNTFAGVLIDGAGNTIAGVPVFARHFILDTVVYADTTDDNGKFGLPVTLQGQYGLSAQTDSLEVLEQNQMFLRISSLESRTLWSIFRFDCSSSCFRSASLHLRSAISCRAKDAGNG